LTKEKKNVVITNLENILMVSNLFARYTWNMFLCAYKISEQVPLSKCNGISLQAM